MSSSPPTHTLYLCYFGLREPLVQTQVLPYLRQLVAPDFRVSLLTFEPNFKSSWSAAQIAQQRELLAGENISWHCLPYHKRPSAPATLYDVLTGARFAASLAREQGINVFHARSHVGAMMGALAKKFGGNKQKLIFDIRGFLPEEYTDGGIWKPNGALYRTVKRIERDLLRGSDGFVVLTEKAREILFPASATNGSNRRERPVEVIPCCVDLERFQTANAASRVEVRQQLNLGERQVIVYIGSLGTWYMANEMTDFLAVARRQNPKTFAMILTHSPSDGIRANLEARGFSSSDYYISKVSPAEIPRYLSAADVALSFIRATYSKLSSSPTKLAEYLASGLPIVCNRGVGDVDKQIETDRVGTLIDDFTPEEYARALGEIERLRQDPDLSERCRESARNRFDLVEVGGTKYRRLYQKLFAGAE